jgi:hypothetical protein
MFSDCCQRAGNIVNSVHSAHTNGHDPYAYLEDMLDCLPTQPASRIAGLLPHNWKPTAAAFSGRPNRAWNWLLRPVSRRVVATRAVQ